MGGDPGLAGGKLIIGRARSPGPSPELKESPKHLSGRRGKGAHRGENSEPVSQPKGEKGRLGGRGWGEKGWDKLASEQLVCLKGAHPTHGGAQAGSCGRQHEPRSLYLLENEGFHSSDEGHKRMKHKHSRNSKPQGENPLHHCSAEAPGCREAGSQPPVTAALPASEAHGASLPSRVAARPLHVPLPAWRPGGCQGGTGVAGGSPGLLRGAQQAT